MADTHARVRMDRMAAFWLVRMKRRQINDKTIRPRYLPLLMKIKKRRFFLVQAILSCLYPPRLREVWMRPRSFAWFDMVETSFNDEQWYSNFRVTSGTFKYVIDKICIDISHQDTVMRKAVSARRRLAITLYYLASTAEYRTIANLFGVSVSFVCACIKEVCSAIMKRMPSLISFPSGEDLSRVIQGYEEWGFPMCGGAIDGTHIPILAPTESHLDYVNRKGFHSIIMQAVVDHQYLFRDIVVGWPGSVHDARVLSNSTLYAKGNNNELFSGNCSKQIYGQNINPVLIGDPAYPLMSWLMKPYPENNATPNTQKTFNYQLSRARMTVENTFGRWKGRFVRFSKRVDMEVPSLVIVITASCIMHNVCEIQNNEFLPVWQIDANHPLSVQDLCVFADNQVMIKDATDIREALSQYIMSNQ